MSNHGSATALPGALLVNNLPFRALSLLGMVLEFTMTSLVRHIRRELEAKWCRTRKAEERIIGALGSIYSGIARILSQDETDSQLSVIAQGVPHATTKDDVFNGFLIPKGAIVIANSWAILHDPTIYPEHFKPERFLNPDGSLLGDPILTSSFGYGKAYMSWETLRGRNVVYDCCIRVISF
ncbi:hypothetical protein BC826DRAFT_1150247 [Russula brevipes]|nr:hypothetical protein BC826DRAFT_1150247 [Russula brevipes]